MSNWRLHNPGEHLGPLDGVGHDLHLDPAYRHADTEDIDYTPGDQ